jgi:hypothetical protein
MSFEFSDNEPLHLSRMNDTSIPLVQCINKLLQDEEK